MSLNSLLLYFLCEIIYLGLDIVALTLFLMGKCLYHRCMHSITFKTQLCLSLYRLGSVNSTVKPDTNITGTLYMAMVSLGHPFACSRVY